MPGGIGSVAAEEGLSDLFTVSVECGPIGGIPLGGMEFGASVNPEAMYRMSDTLQLYDGGALDMAVLGFAEVDRYGNVNASSFHGRMVGRGALSTSPRTPKNSASSARSPQASRTWACGTMAW